MGENIQGYDPLAICGCKSETDCPAPIVDPNGGNGGGGGSNFLLYLILILAVVIVTGLVIYILKL
jgi:hypothetical protein